MANQKSPPNDTELELSLFGRGIGECIVIHLGNKRWIVVDSFCSQSSTAPIAMQYFKSIGVDIKSHVKMIVATHWHDDHIMGMAELLRNSEHSKFVCSAALKCKEFLTLLEAGRKARFVEHSSSTSEFREIMEILLKRSAGSAGPDYWAAEGLLLFNASDPHHVQIQALSPSSHTISEAMLRFSELIPKVGEEIGRFPDTSPNAHSVVIAVNSNEVSLLLGADLENSANERHGWKAIIGSSVRLPLKSFGYKVAHHGSDSANAPEIWCELLEEKPVAVLTTYLRGPKKLPSPEDVARLKSNAGRVYCTRNSPGQKPPPRGTAVDSTMRAVTRSRLAIPAEAGHIRIRRSISDRSSCPVIELFNGATRL